MNKLFFLILFLISNTYAFDINSDKKQCNNNDMFACARIAQAYQQGTNKLKSDPVQALKYLKKSCVLGFKANCKKIPITRENNKHLATAIKLGTKPNQYGYKMLEKMCSVNNARACYTLYSLHKNLNKEEDKLLTEQYYKKTKELTEKDCTENNDAQSCEFLWRTYDVENRKNEAEQYFQKAKTLYKKNCDNEHKNCLEYQLLIRTHTKWNTK